MIQKKLISLFLQPLGKWMDRFSEKTKDRIFVIFTLLLFLVYFARNTSGLATAPYLPFFAVGCLCMGMMILSIICSEIKPVSFSHSKSGVKAWRLIFGVCRGRTVSLRTKLSKRIPW